MNTKILNMVMFSACMAIGCVDDASEPEILAVDVADATAFAELDASELAPMASGVELALPAARGVNAEGLEAIGSAVLGEPLRFTVQRGAVAVAQSENFRAESDAATGSFVVSRKESVDEASAIHDGVPEDEISPEALERRAMAVAAALGIPAEEIGVVAQREAMQQSAERAGPASAPELTAHKTFLLRSVHGIEVQGSRIVVTHDPAGRLARIAGRWPALASSGHRLTTSLSPERLTVRVASQMAAEGLAGRAARLRYVYVPEQAGDNPVRLHLHVAAVVARHPDPAWPSMPRELLIRAEP